MIPVRGLIQSLKGWLGKPVASPDSDPERFFGPLFAMPNPDPILRAMGQAERVYFSIAADPHVLGDIRSIYGNFRSHDYRLVAGDEGDSKSLAALALCEQWLRNCQPNPMADWLDVMWQMSTAFMTGYRPHEVVWQLTGGKYLPGEVWDRPNRRIVFNAYGQPMLISRTNMMGAPLEDPFQFVISRHMATLENPYGVAVLSSCFWPWTFKTGGWRYFVKYCERHGLPWPIARYPLGTNDVDQNKLADALANMIEAAYAVVPEGTGVELMQPTTNSGGTLPQQNLIDLANREMSKAMTGQAMVAELQGVGARAASETAAKRQQSIDDSVRDIAIKSMGQIFRWITLFNFGDGVAPPTIEFFLHQNAGKDRAETYEVAVRLGARPSRKSFLEEMGIPEAQDDADLLRVLPSTGTAPASPASQRPGSGQPGAAPGNAGQDALGSADAVVLSLAGLPGYQFAQAVGTTDDEAVALAIDAADKAIEDHMIAPVAGMLARFEAEGRSLAEFRDALQDVVGVIDDTALREVVERSLAYAYLSGAATDRS